MSEPEFAAWHFIFLNIFLQAFFSCTSDNNPDDSVSGSSSSVKAYSSSGPSSSFINSSSSAPYVGKGNDIANYRTVEMYGMLYDWTTAMALLSNCNPPSSNIMRSLASESSESQEAEIFIAVK